MQNEYPHRYAQRVAELYYPYSRSAKFKQRENILGSLIGTVAGHQDGITVSGLIDSTSINESTMRHYLNMLKKRGSIEVETVRGAQVVRLKD